MQMEEALKKYMKAALEESKYRLGLAAGRLKGVSPLEKLGQGYSYAVSVDGGGRRSIENVQEGDNLTLYVTDGKVDAKVVSKQKLEYSR